MQTIPTRIMREDSEAEVDSASTTARSVHTGSVEEMAQEDVQFVLYRQYFN